MIREEIKDIKKRFGKVTTEGARRTDFAEAPDVGDISLEAFVEKEPITVVYTRMGWIKALKGYVDDLSDVKLKEGDVIEHSTRAQTTDTILFFGSNGRFYSLTGDKLPGGKGFGEPLRLMIDLPNDANVVSLLVHQPERKLLLASTIGKGFVVEEKLVIASTKGGKQVLNPAKGSALLCRVVEGGMVASIGENRKLLIFPIDQIPQMNRGQGVVLQRFKDGGLSDVKLFTKEEGLSWSLGSKTRTEHDLTAWEGNRAGAGRLPPTGFPRTNKFD